ncbi:MAG: nucleotide exchange factor GrpE [Gammaproteobacteria bacterium]|nr:MAG: nucleotide exchange factor GrpE [Gammaproteobacteria bacterium]
MTATHDEHSSATEDEHDEMVDDAAKQEELQAELDDDASDVSEGEVFSPAEQRINELTDSLLRARAETDNIRRRSERDIANAHKYGLERFASQLLPVRDGLELGLVAASQENATIDRIKEGMDMTLKMLTDVMEKASIIELNPLGEKFDPERHQAMQMQETDEADPNTVIVVHQKGYLLNDRLIRPAMVVVAKPKRL